MRLADLRARSPPHRAVALPAHEQLGATFDGFLNPVVEALRFLDVDHWADKGLAVVRIARDERLGFRNESLLEIVVHRFVDDDALDPDAALPGLVKGAESKDRKSIVEGKSVSVRVDLGGRR